MSDERTVLDAVRSALHSEPRVHPTEGPIHLAFADGEALEGTVPREAERTLAEDDAWYVFGVDKVVNRLTVRA